MLPFIVSMNMLLRNITPSIFLIFWTLLSSCGSSDITPSQKSYIPPAPDYSKSSMWITYTNDLDGTGADVFYIPSTWEFDWTTPEGLICHYADITNQQHLDDMAIEMTGVADYMADGNNFYSPFYRHITLDTWATLDENLIFSRYNEVSLVDVQKAFAYYMDNYNEGRPFILAGFSQGGKSVVELLKALPEDLRDRLVAAYVLGYKITPDDILSAPWIKAAQREGDTGVTICYNSVSDTKYVKPIIAAPNVMCINPVNWTTQETPAILNDTITVTLSKDYHVLVLEGFDGSYLPNILDILNVGDYHGAEPWLYSQCLHENFKCRINSYWNQHR